MRNSSRVIKTKITIFPWILCLLIFPCFPSYIYFYNLTCYPVDDFVVSTEYKNSEIKAPGHRQKPKNLLLADYETFRLTDYS